MAQVNANRIPLSGVLIPLLLGVAVGMLLVQGKGALPFKWNVFIVGAVTGICVLVIVGSLTSHLKGAMLFLAVLTLPTFYGIDFLYRERVSFMYWRTDSPYAYSISFLSAFRRLDHEMWSILITCPGSWISPLDILLISWFPPCRAPEPFSLQHAVSAVEILSRRFTATTSVTNAPSD